MRPGARLQAAIEVLHEIIERGRHAPSALHDFGRTHRFAGSADRAAIGNLVYDVLRQRQSLAFRMRAGTPRALALAALRHIWRLPEAEIAELCDGGDHHPAPLTPEEARNLASGGIDGAAPFVTGDFPEWLQASFAAAFGGDAVREGAALAERAPVDLRVNTLKATRDKVLKALARYGAMATPWSPVGVRLPARRGPARSANVEADAAHGRGWFEVQDEGSQLAAILAGAAPRAQVADICAGAGGKTLALAAAMQNTGQIHAYDADRMRFRPIFDRLKRAGARNVQTLPPGDGGALAALAARMDLVLVDAPCSGSGAWRRHPDAKWRLTPAQLAKRQETQRKLLAAAAPLVRPGGTLAYATCSVLPEENASPVRNFLAANPDFSPIDVRGRAKGLLAKELPEARASEAPGLLLTPARHGTDGFYIALLRKSG